MKTSLCLFLLLFISSNLVINAQIEGSWYANLDTGNTVIPLVFHFEKADNQLWSGSLDSPKQKMFGLKLDQVIFKNDSLQLKAKSLGITYNGKLINEKIDGLFKQGMFKENLSLTREKIKAKAKEKNVNRPQEPTPPFNYEIEDVSFINTKDSITLAGTLTFPKEKTNFPLVVMISGSGAQDRNSEILDHKPFLVAADYLSNNGIGVLRFDDRGTAESEGDFSSATSVDFMEDVYAAVQFLKEDKRFKKHKIGLYGHSEGGMIAPLLADTYKDAVDFLVLLAPPAVPIPDLMLKQQALIGLASGLDSLEVNRNAQVNRKAYQIINEFEAKDNKELQDTLQRYFTKVTIEHPEVVENMGLNKDGYILTMIQAYTNPWMVNFLRHKPEKYLKDLKLPILALFAENDLQVAAKQNEGKMKELILDSNPINEVKTFNNKNHLFQTSSTGNLDEYSEIEETISFEVLEKVKNWIHSL